VHPVGFYYIDVSHFYAKLYFFSYLHIHWATYLRAYLIPTYVITGLSMYLSTYALSTKNHDPDNRRPSPDSTEETPNTSEKRCTLHLEPTFSSLCYQYHNPQFTRWISTRSEYQNSWLWNPVLSHLSHLQ